MPLSELIFGTQPLVESLRKDNGNMTAATSVFTDVICVLLYAAFGKASVCAMSCSLERPHSKEKKVVSSHQLGRQMLLV